MPVPNKWAVAPCLLLIAALSAAGCAHRSLPTVPSESDRASLRHVGVAAGSYLPEPSFLAPAKGAGEGAVKGGVIAFAGPLVGGGTGAGPYGLLVGVVVGAALAPVGAVIGASSAMPAAEARSSEASLRNALAGSKVHETLRDRIAAEGKAAVPARSVTPVDIGPAGPTDNVAYGLLSGKGFDAILEVRVVRFGLRTATWGADPPLELFLDANVRLVRTRDDAVLWTRSLWLGSPPRRNAEWTTDGGRPVREALASVCADVAARIVEEVFILVPLP